MSRHDNDFMLADNSGGIKCRGVPCIAFLTTAYLRFYSAYRSAGEAIFVAVENKPPLEISLSSVVGSTCRLSSSSNRNEAVNQLSVFYYPVVKVKKTGKIRKRKVLNLAFHLEPFVCQSWSNAINNIAITGNIPIVTPGTGGGTEEDQEERDLTLSVYPTYVAPDPRHFMVIVNPVGGQRLGKKIWLRTVEPMLAEAGAEAHLLMTEYANHARDVITETDLSIFYAIVCIGGDGIVYEVINGITSKPGGFDLLRSINLVHIPGGTSNGLAKSVLFGCGEAYSPVNAMFVGLKGEPRPLDLSIISPFKSSWEGAVGHSSSTVHTSDIKISPIDFIDGNDTDTAASAIGHNNHEVSQRISFLIQGWGFVADVDIMSESMRCLGELRLFVAAAYFIGKRKMYTGRLRMKTANPRKVLVSPQPNIGNNLTAACFNSDGDSSAILYEDHSSSSSTPGHNNFHSGGIHTDPEADCITTSVDEFSSDNGWITLEGKFTMVWVVQTSHSSASVYSGPGVELDDGLFTIYVVQEVSRVALLSLMLAADTGKHVQHPAVSEYKCTEYVLEPLLSENGIIDIDGEMQPYAPIKAQVLPAATRVMSLK